VLLAVRSGREECAMESLVFLVVGMVIVAIAWIAYERWSG
jgi:hypothetical protein